VPDRKNSTIGCRQADDEKMIKIDARLNLTQQARAKSVILKENQNRHAATWRRLSIFPKNDVVLLPMAIICNF